MVGPLSLAYSAMAAPPKTGLVNHDLTVLGTERRAVGRDRGANAVREPNGDLAQVRGVAEQDGRRLLGRDDRRQRRHRRDPAGGRPGARRRPPARGLAPSAARLVAAASRPLPSSTAETVVPRPSASRVPAPTSSAEIGARAPSIVSATTRTPPLSAIIASYREIEMGIKSASPRAAGWRARRRPLRACRLRSGRPSPRAARRRGAAAVERRAPETSTPSSAAVQTGICARPAAMIPRSGG